MLVFVVLYAAFVAPAGTYPGLRLDALSTLFYVANWHFILTGSNYFDQTSLPSLLTHTWSLAVEEQFYLLWPLVVLGVLKFTGRLWALLAVSVVGALASAIEMALLFRHGAGLTRLYYGTDTHGQCMLVGAALAVGPGPLRPRPPCLRDPTPRRAGPRGESGVGGIEPLAPAPSCRSSGERGRWASASSGGGAPTTARFSGKAGSWWPRWPRRPSWSAWSAPSGRGWPSPCRSARCATSAASPMASTSGTIRSSSGSTGSGPG